MQEKKCRCRGRVKLLNINIKALSKTTRRRANSHFSGRLKNFARPESALKPWQTPEYTEFTPTEITAAVVWNYF